MILYSFDRFVRRFEPYGVLLAVIGLFLSLIAFSVDYRDRVEERTVRAWQLLTAKAPGNSGKKEALEYLNKREGFFCGDDGCLITLKERTRLVGIDLSVPDGKFGVYLRGVNLSGADLTGADLRGADLIEADFSGADLIEANLSGAYLSTANLRGATFRRANLSGAYLSGADLSGADLRGANFIEADLRDVNLIEADLLDADLSKAGLYGASVTQGQLNEACSDGGTSVFEGLRAPTQGTCVPLPGLHFSKTR